MVLGALGGLETIIRSGNMVLIKPNFVAPFVHATTSLEILEAIVKKVKEVGGEPIVAESAGFEFDTEETFKLLGLYQFGQRNQVRIVNLDKEPFQRVRLASGLAKEVEVSATALEADVLINVPKLKRHSVTKVTLASKNLLGLLSRESRRRLHAFGLERGIFELSKIVPSRLVLVDASVIGSRAVFGEHNRLGAIVAGTDVYSVDAFCCRLLCEDDEGVGYLRIARNRGLISKRVICSLNGETIDDVFPPGHAIRERRYLRDKLNPILYQSLYLVDIVINEILRLRSIVPILHFYLGVRPQLDGNKCTKCETCLEVCPVSAIDISKKAINVRLCMPLRCMRCVAACPSGAMVIRGRSIPKNFEDGAIKILPLPSKRVER